MAFPIFTDSDTIMYSPPLQGETSCILITHPSLLSKVISRHQKCHWARQCEGVTIWRLIVISERSVRKEFLRAEICIAPGSEFPVSLFSQQCDDKNNAIILVPWTGSGHPALALTSARKLHGKDLGQRRGGSHVRTVEEKSEHRGFPDSWTLGVSVNFSYLGIPSFALGVSMFSETIRGRADVLIAFLTAYSLSEYLTLQLFWFGDCRLNIRHMWDSTKFILYFKHFVWGRRDCFTYLLLFILINCCGFRIFANSVTVPLNSLLLFQLC